MIIEHKHVIIRADIKSPPGADELGYMRDWFTKLIANIGMKVLKGPYVHYLDKAGNRGFTGIAIIETSHIAMHVWDEDSPGLMQLDVYTCADLDVSKVIAAMQEFEPTSVEYIFLDRKNKLEIHEAKVIQP
jgi:S-adenosylmethionine/arginine decarboxylase-like enzyme